MTIFFKISLDPDSHPITKVVLGLLVFVLMIQMPANAQPHSAQGSDARTIEWMNGFPPPKEKIIRFTDPDYFSYPKLRWTVCNFRELMPTVGIDRGPNNVRPLETAIDHGISDVSFKPLGQSETMTWNQAYDANYTDGAIVLHRGRIVYERYSGCLNKRAQHGAMSVTKSITGLLGEVLIAEGVINEFDSVGSLVSELASSAFGDATVRQLLEMTTALDFSENYADPDAEVWTYAAAGSPLPKPEGYDGPRSYFEYLETVRKKGKHGQSFGYKTVNADALGWVIARTSGKSVADLLSERIWQRLGADREAFFTVDSIGTPFAGGGFNATLRDMARLGQLMLDGGKVNGEQIIPAAAVERIRQGGSRKKFTKGGYTLDGWSYQGMWWNTHDDHGAYAARGVHGQTIWIDPKADMVIARFSSNPVAGNAANDPTSLPAYRAVANYLLSADNTDPLISGRWIIEDIMGDGVIDNTQASLSFGKDGDLSGNATCNRLIGSYTVDGEDIAIKRVGSTMMVCPEALMFQERRLLDLLPTVVRYEIDKGRTLILITTDGSTVTARPM